MVAAASNPPRTLTRMATRRPRHAARAAAATGTTRDEHAQRLGPAKRAPRTGQRDAQRARHERDGEREGAKRPPEGARVAQVHAPVRSTLRANGPYGPTVGISTQKPPGNGPVR